MYVNLFRGHPRLAERGHEDLPGRARLGEGLYGGLWTAAFTKRASGGGSDSRAPVNAGGIGDGRSSDIESFHFRECVAAGTCGSASVRGCGEWAVARGAKRRGWYQPAPGEKGGGSGLLRNTQLPTHSTQQKPLRQPTAQHSERKCVCLCVWWLSLPKSGGVLSEELTGPRQPGRVGGSSVGLVRSGWDEREDRSWAEFE